MIRFIVCYANAIWTTGKKSKSFIQLLVLYFKLPQSRSRIIYASDRYSEQAKPLTVISMASGAITNYT